MKKINRYVYEYDSFDEWNKDFISRQKQTKQPEKPKMNDDDQLFNVGMLMHEGKYDEAKKAIRGYVMYKSLKNQGEDVLDYDDAEDWYQSWFDQLAVQHNNPVVEASIKRVDALVEEYYSKFYIAVVKTKQNQLTNNLILCIIET